MYIVVGIVLPNFDKGPSGLGAEFAMGLVCGAPEMSIYRLTYYNLNTLAAYFIFSIISNGPFYINQVACRNRVPVASHKVAWAPFFSSN